MMRKTRIVAALMCLLLLLSLLAGCKKEDVGGSLSESSVSFPKAGAVALPHYRVEAVEYTLPERVPYRQGLQPYFETVIPALLKDAEKENTVCSPVNIYMALAMLAEITDGQSRAQLETLLGAETPQLRDWASEVWQNNYRGGKGSQLLLGGSIWLNEGMTFRQDCLDLLADRYYASVYQGAMGSEAFSQTYRDWMNEHTGGLLKDQIDGMELTADLALNLSATVYFTGGWSSAFDKNLTVPQTFYAPAGETEVQMMKKTVESYYFWGEHFTSVLLPMDTGRIVFLLPDEGYTPAELLRDGEALDYLISGAGQVNRKYMKVHLSVPRFDIVSKTELIGSLQELGVTDVFTCGAADFSPITDAEGLCASTVLHGARVKVDEEKVEAAAYTAVSVPASPPPQEVEEIDFTLDRPFLFCITGDDGLPLFTGIVNQP